MTTISFLLNGRIRAASHCDADDPYGPEIQRKAYQVITLIRDASLQGRMALVAATSSSNVTTILWQSRRPT